MLKHLTLTVGCLVLVACTRTSSGVGDFDSHASLGQWGILAADTRPEVEAQFARAHALFALNRNNEATCLLVRLSAKPSSDRWLAWTSGLVTRFPDRHTAHYLYGDALARGGRAAEAIAAFDEALKLDSRDHLALNARGVLHALAALYDLALVDFDDAVNASSEFAEAATSKGFLSILRGGSTNSAERAFDSALTLSPGYSFALQGRGYIDVVQGAPGGMDQIRQAAAANTCTAPFVAADLLALAGAIGPIAVESDGQHVGTTLREDLSKALQGDQAAMRRVAATAAERPETRPQIDRTLQAASRYDPQVKERFGQAVNERVTRLETQRTAVEVASGIKLETGLTGTVGAESKIGAGLKKLEVQVGGRNTAEANAGMTVDLEKSTAGVRDRLNQRIDAAKNLQNTSPAAKEQIGGLTTSLVNVRFDNGEWQRLVHFGLLY